MKTGLILLCRYNSSRLPGKILKEINGKPLLAYIIERLKLSNASDQVIVATSDQETDNPIANYCEKSNVACFRGSLYNVAGRFLECAEYYNLDFAIRINGDNIFTDHHIIDEMISIAHADNYDFVSNVAGRTFPYGMSIEIIKVAFYREIFKHFDTDYFKEHVTIYLYEHPEEVKNVLHFKNKWVPEASGLKLAVDSSEDFKFATEVINRMQSAHTDYGLKEITDLIKSLK
ncbi:MAG: hypothetical protein AAFQ94_13215 [Bacteroidota bacterium]